MQCLAGVANYVTLSSVLPALSATINDTHSKPITARYLNIYLGHPE